MRLQLSRRQQRISRNHKKMDATQLSRQQHLTETQHSPEMLEETQHLTETQRSPEMLEETLEETQGPLAPGIAAMAGERRLPTAAPR